MPPSEEYKKQRARNWAIAGFLVFMVVLFFLATMVKVKEGAGVAG